VRAWRVVADAMFVVSELERAIQLRVGRLHRVLYTWPKRWPINRLRVRMMRLAWDAYVAEFGSAPWPRP